MIKELTSLRFIFIIFIFIHHLGLYPGGGALSVAFFFVLSGYCMTLGYKDKILEPTFSYKAYILKRAIKFYPLHWLCLLATLPLFYLGGHSLGLFSPKFFLNALLLQSFVPVRDIYFSYNAVSWYLSDTLFFAIVFPLLGKIIFSSLRVLQLFFILTLVVLYTYLLINLPADMRHAILYINPIVRCVDFIIGMYLALAYLWLRQRKWICKAFKSTNEITFLIIALLIGISVLLSNSIPDINHLRCYSFLYWPVIALVILFTSLSYSFGHKGGGGKILQSQELLMLGGNTFTFFMTHLQVILFYDYVLVFFRSTGFPMLNKCIYYGGASLRFVTCFFITIALSLLIDKYFFIPLSQWLTKRIQPYTTVQS